MKKQYKMIALLGVVSFTAIGLTVSLLNNTNKEEVKVENIVKGDNIKMKNVGDVLKLTCEVTPLNATNKKVTWTSSDSKKIDIIESDNTSCTIKKLVNYSGSVRVTVTTEDGNFTAYCDVYSYNYISNITYLGMCGEQGEMPCDWYIDQDSYELTNEIKNTNEYYLMFEVSKSSDSNRDFDYTAEDIASLKSIKIDETYFSQSSVYLYLEDIKDTKLLNAGYFGIEIVAKDELFKITGKNYVTLSITFEGITEEFNIYPNIKATGINISSSSVTL